MNENFTTVKPINRTALILMLVLLIFGLTYLAKQLLPKMESSVYNLDTLVPVIQTGTFVDITLTAVRYDSVTVRFPESEFTKKFTFDLGEDFVNFEDPDWWKNLQVELQHLDDYEHNKGEKEYFSSRVVINSSDSTAEPTFEADAFTVRKMPSVEWMEANVRRSVDKPFLYVEISLPADGVMKQAVSDNFYKDEISSQRYYYETKAELPLMQLQLNDEAYHSLWSVGAFDQGGGQKVFVEPLDYLQDIYQHTLIYRYPDGRYLLIVLPNDLLSQTEESLEKGDYITTISVEILQVK